MAPGRGEAATPQSVRLFSRRRAGLASSGETEEETMGEIWWAGGRRYRGIEDLALGFFLFNFYYGRKGGVTTSSHVPRTPGPVVGRLR